MQKEIRLLCGRTVGNLPTSNNVREDVLVVLDRLHVLWSLNDDPNSPDNFGRVYQKAAGYAPGSRVPEADLEPLAKAIERNEVGSLSGPVATRFLNRRIDNSVGFKQQNDYIDFIAAQSGLTEKKYLSEIVRAAERADIDRIFRDKRVTDEGLYPRTITAITDLKRAVAEGRFGWLPVRADELACDGDRFMLQTYEYDEFSVFVPLGYKPSSETLRVHVFFSPGGASGGRIRGAGHVNEMLVHGFRAAFHASDWILIGVPGDPDYPLLTTGRLESILERAGVLFITKDKKRTVGTVRLSAYSGGTKGLRNTMTQQTPPFSLAQIERIYILDDESPVVYDFLRAINIPEEKVTFYRCTGLYKNMESARQANPKKYNMPRSASRLGYNLQETMRIIGYARAVQDGLATRPNVKDQIPSDIRKAVDSLGLPPRGCLCSLKPVLPCQKTIAVFMQEKKRELAQLSGMQKTIKQLVDRLDLLWYNFTFTDGIDAHHFWLPEFVHELAE